MQSCKILLTGTLRSGKTTFLREFQHHPQFAIIPEVAQDIIDQHGYEITQNPAFEDMILEEQLRREAIAETLGKPYILCDRGTLDNVAFARLIGFPIKTEWLEHLPNRYQAAAIFNKDDIQFDPKEYEGSVNFDMVAYRARADQLIREVVAEVGLPVIELRGTHQERLTTFHEYLRRATSIEGNFSLLRQESSALSFRCKERR